MIGEEEILSQRLSQLLVDKSKPDLSFMDLLLTISKLPLPSEV
jgi:hypothetical protein